MDNAVKQNVSDQHLSYTASIITSTLWSAIFFLITILNILALIAFHRTRHFHGSTTKIFLMSLATADLCIGFAFAAPTTVLTFYNCACKQFCQIQAYGGLGLQIGALSSLFAVNIERFIVIVYPLHHQMILSPMRAKMIVCVIWISVACCVMIVGLVSDWGTLTFFLNCHTSAVVDMRYIFWIVFVVCIVLYITTITMYVKVYVVSRKHNKRLNQFRRIKHESKTAQTVFILLAMYGVSWIPTLVSGTYLFISGVEASEYIAHPMQMINISCSWFNPLIYVIRNEQFRKELRIVWRCGT